MSVAVHMAGVAAPFDEHHCRRNVQRRPKSGPLRYDLALALTAAGDPAEAVEQCSKALALQPNLHRAARLLGSLLQRYALNAEIDIAPRGLEAAFAFVDVDRQALGNAAVAYLKNQPPLSDALRCGRNDGWNAAAAFLLTDKGRKFLQNRLFRSVLTHSVNTDLELEFLLTALRRHFLLSPDSISARPIYEFACRLIRQCHNNGHVYFATETEKECLKTLEFDVGAILNGETSQVGDFILAGLYRPLHGLVGTADVTGGFDKASPHALRPVLQHCLVIHRTDASCAAAMPHLTKVTNETSRRVAAQYLVDPYPQWLSLQAPEPASATVNLRNHFSAEQLAPIADTCDVLIAGAGTCEQAICSAIAYGPQARVLAIDLSAQSLAYGARMAHSFGTDNLRFALADILRLGEIEDRFDVIECGGVLHHMDEPFEAWETLVDRLRPGGLMQIGLYSAVSRRVIEELADNPDWPGPDADDDALRTFRNKLMRQGSGATGFELSASIDFYTKSGFRDLALHVSEQRCTIPEIRDFIADNGLEFHGFILSPEVHAAYCDQFPHDVQPGTLEHWWKFEQANPRTFDGMYVFWCRLPDTV